MQGTSHHLQLALPALVIAGVVLTVGQARKPYVHPSSSTAPALRALPGAADTLALVEGCFDHRWQRSNLVPAPPATEVTILRRLSLAFHGSVPSLEELAAFERDREPDRLDRWTTRLWRDPRTSDHMAERFARAVVGTDGGDFVVFRRDRLVNWLSQQLSQAVPFDQTARQLISERGLWTTRPATNFITAALNQDKIDVMKLTGRTVRAFLGQRIDCAQCHDHPFASWKQSQFEGLAAFYGHVEKSIIGVDDKPLVGDDGKPRDFQIEDLRTLKFRAVTPSVPFQPDLVPLTGTLRERLATWVTHPRNERFGRATVNRVWGFVFGRPYQIPVDDLGDPPSAGDGDALSLLARDFVTHGHDLERLVTLITRLRAFRMESRVVAPSGSVRSARGVKKSEEAWALFPLVRLRPDQVIGALLQATSIKSVDRNAHVFQRFLRFVREADFVKGYGDFGENELDERTGTVPQRLLMLNGKLVRELTEPNPFGAPGRIASMAPTDDECVTLAYRACLTRDPTEAERRIFVARLGGTQGDPRGHVLEDLYWTLVNSTEFSWSH